MNFPRFFLQLFKITCISRRTSVLPYCSSLQSRSVFLRGPNWNRYCWRTGKRQRGFPRNLFNPTCTARKEDGISSVNACYWKIAHWDSTTSSLLIKLANNRLQESEHRVTSMSGTNRSNSNKPTHNSLRELIEGLWLDRRMRFDANMRLIMFWNRVGFAHFNRIEIRVRQPISCLSLPHQLHYFRFVTNCNSTSSFTVSLEQVFM